MSERCTQACNQGSVNRYLRLRLLLGAIDRSVFHRLWYFPREPAQTGHAWLLSNRAPSIPGSRCNQSASDILTNWTRSRGPGKVPARKYLSFLSSLHPYISILFYFPLRSGSSLFTCCALQIEIAVVDVNAVKQQLRDRVPARLQSERGGETGSQTVREQCTTSYGRVSFRVRNGRVVLWRCLDLWKDYCLTL